MFPTHLDTDSKKSTSRSPRSEVPDLEHIAFQWSDLAEKNSGEAEQGAEAAVQLVLQTEQSLATVG